MNNNNNNYHDYHNYNYNYNYNYYTSTNSNYYNNFTSFTFPSIEYHHPYGTPLAARHPFFTTNNPNYSPAGSSSTYPVSPTVYATPHAVSATTLPSLTPLQTRKEKNKEKQNEREREIQQILSAERLDNDLYEKLTKLNIAQQKWIFEQLLADPLLSNLLTDDESSTTPTKADRTARPNKRLLIRIAAALAEERNETSIHVVVRRFDGEEISLTLSSEATLQDLKELIEARFDGKTLQERSKKISWFE